MSESPELKYEVYLSANVRSDDGLSNFSIVKSQKIALDTFAELDELMARMRKAISPEPRQVLCGRCELLKREIQELKNQVESLEGVIDEWRETCRKDSH